MYAETSLNVLSTIGPGTKIDLETLNQFFYVNQAQIQYLENKYASIFSQQPVRLNDIKTLSSTA